MKRQLKQPGKFTHASLIVKLDMELAENSSSENLEIATNKVQLKEEGDIPQSCSNQGQKFTKKQQKVAKKMRKVINKPNEPSAIRLAQINKTFEKLEENSEHYLSQLNVDHKLLEELSQQQTKSKCKCGKNVKYYCLKCMTKCTPICLPTIELPIQVRVIHHLSEKINKSSIIPMTFMSPDIKLYNYKGAQPEVNGKKENLLRKEINDENLFTVLPKPSQGTFILFPHKRSKSVSQIDPSAIKNLIILDCTWFQTDQIINDLQYKGYRNYIKLSGYKSLFWRYNHYSDEALCSAESLMHFMREHQTQKLQSAGEQSLANSGSDRPLLPNMTEVKKYDQLMLLYCLNMVMVTRNISEQKSSTQ